MVQLTAIIATSASAPVDVPDDLRAELVELYKHLKDHPDQRGHATFETPDEAALFVRQVKAWAAANDVEYRQVRGSASEDGLSFAFYLRDPLSDADKEAAQAERAARAAERVKAGKGKPGRKPKAQ